MSPVEAIPADVLMMCSFRAGPGLFGIDTTQIREVLGATAPQPVPLAPAYIDGVAPYRGDVLTTLSFRVLLGLEKRAGANCVLVLDDEENEELFGLVVDEVLGVATIPRDSLEPNPATLDARSLALFDGAFRTPSGLMVRLDPRRLRPSRLAESGFFASVQRGGKGELR